MWIWKWSVGGPKSQGWNAWRSSYMYHSFSPCTYWYSYIEYSMWLTYACETNVLFESYLLFSLFTLRTWRWWRYVFILLSIFDKCLLFLYRISSQCLISCYAYSCFTQIFCMHTFRGSKSYTLVMHVIDPSYSLSFNWDLYIWTYIWVYDTCGVD